MTSTALANLPEGIFKPIKADVFETLLASYDHAKTQLIYTSKVLESEDAQNSLGYFLRGFTTHNYTPSDPSDILKLPPALAVLNADYWQKALRLTDVLDFMPAKRRDEWHNLIRDRKTPDFEADAVRETILDLMRKRLDFFSEMVDGIFQGLSREHLTNRPEGFTKRFILNYVYDTWGSSYHKAGLIHDFRSVLAKIMGRGQPQYGATDSLLRTVRKETGIWHVVDGGAFRLRVYKKGTAHLEVHPDISWRLNRILAHMHPNVIAGAHRERPKESKPIKDFVLMEKPLPFAVLSFLQDRSVSKVDEVPAKWQLWLGADWKEADKHLRLEVLGVFLALGGVYEENRVYFDYDVSPVFQQICISGMLPDETSHQYYPTPEKVAKAAAGYLGVETHDWILEPSAGQGGLAEILPPRQTCCIEISPLFCEILKAKGYGVECADFLTWNPERRPTKILMNPPFSQNRAKLHLAKAAGILEPGGRLVCILPASYSGKDLLPGWNAVWSEIFKNEFEGTGISTVILIGDKPL